MHKMTIVKVKKITVALGQTGSKFGGTHKGCGETFAVIKQQNGPEPIFVAGGAGANMGEKNYRQSILRKNLNENDWTVSSGPQKFISNESNDGYCGGARFSESPNVGALMADSVLPQTYTQGLTGGQGKYLGDLRKIPWRFVCYYKNWHWYYEAGGEFTGGSTRVRDGSHCAGSGGGLFSVDKDAAFDHFFVECGKCKIQFVK